MRKPKERHDDDDDEVHFFDDFDSEDVDDDDALNDREARLRKKPARQRVELRSEQQFLRRQLSDWDDYDYGAGQDDFDTKL